MTDFRNGDRVQVTIRGTVRGTYSTHLEPCSGVTDYLSVMPDGEPYTFQIRPDSHSITIEKVESVEDYDPDVLYVDAVGDYWKLELKAMTREPTSKWRTLGTDFSYGFDVPVRPLTPMVIKESNDG